MSFIVLSIFLIIGGELTRRGCLCDERPKLNPFGFPKDLTVGSRARVLCAAYQGDQPIDFQWLKNGKRVNKGSIQQIDATTSELILEPLALDDIAEYTCIAKNEFGSDTLPASLFVSAPPQWVREPNDVKAAVGEKISVDCEAYGSPDVEVKWKRRSQRMGNLVQVVSSSGLQILLNNTLVILNAQKSEDGAYVCEVTNGIGEPLVKSINVLIFEPPSVYRIGDPVTMEHGKTGTLTCVASGDAPLSLSWLKDRQSVTAFSELSNRLTFTEHPEAASVKFTLTITSVKMTDEGIYTCVAKNEFGSAEQDIRLRLVERPDVPENIEVADIWSRSARIRWSTPANGNSPIFSYVVEYWSNSDAHLNVTVPSSTTSCVLRNLQPFHLYRFHVLALNNIGISDSSTVVQFTTAKEEPSAPPMDLIVEETGSTFVRLAWKPPPPEHWNGGITGYYIGYKQSSSKLPYTYNTVSSTEGAIFYILRSLRKGTRYLVTIKAFNEIGSGPETQEISFRTLSNEPPPRPTLMVNGIGSTYLQLQWFLREETKTSVNSFTIYYRKESEKWQEIAIPDVTQSTFTLTNLDSGVTYQIFMTSHDQFGMSEPSDTATVQTTAEAIIHSSGGSLPPASQAGLDDFTQTMYIVIPIAVSTVIIVVVIVVACVYVYSRRPLLVPQPYADIPPDKSFSYMATVPRRRDLPLTVCGGEMIKHGSPYSTVPLTRSEPEEEEPIYEAVMEEIRCKIRQQAYDDEKKMSSGTIV